MAGHAPKGVTLSRWITKAASTQNMLYRSFITSPVRFYIFNDQGRTLIGSPLFVIWERDVAQCLLIPLKTDFGMTSFSSVICFFKNSLPSLFANQCISAKEQKKWFGMKNMKKNLANRRKSSTFAPDLCRWGQKKQAKRVVSPRGQTRLIQYYKNVRNRRD